MKVFASVCGLIGSAYWLANNSADSVSTFGVLFIFICSGAYLIWKGCYV